MNEIADTNQTDLILLNSLARQAQLFAENIAMNMLQLGRVFTEAKRLIPHGEFGDWVKNNSGMSERYAQQFMQAYARYGINESFAALGKSKLLKMLALPPGEEEAFMAENDVAAMSARQLDEAVKAVRAEARAALEEEKRLRMAAEARAAELASRPAEIPDSVAASLREKDEQITRQQHEISRIAEVGRNSIAEAGELRRKNAALQQELADQSALLEETQAECDRAQNELLNARSAIAKGDAERTPNDQLTADVFASAVRQFIGACARMPHMRSTFSAMPPEEKQEYDTLLRTVESWASQSRKALEAVVVEGTAILHD